MAALDGLNPVVAADPGWQERKRSNWRSYQHALRVGLAPGATNQEDTPAPTHIMVVQDDAIPCRDFAAGALAALAAKPDDVVAFFATGDRKLLHPIERAAAAGHNWLLLPNTRASKLWLPAVCTAYPVAVAERLLEWAQQDHRARVHPWDDAMLGRFLRHDHLDAWVTIPNLVDHDDRVVSIVRQYAGKGRPDRISACFIGDYSPLDIDWRQD